MLSHFIRQQAQAPSSTAEARPTNCWELICVDFPIRAKIATSFPMPPNAPVSGAVARSAEASAPLAG